MQVMRLHLRAWGNAWILYTLDPETGSYGSVKLAKSLNGVPPTNGVASIEPVLGLIGRFYAVYAFEDLLYFQAGRRRWDIAGAEVDTRYWCWLGLASRFHLILNGKSVHRATLVHPSRFIWPFLDPTYDGIDFDSDHFLFFLSEQLKSDEWKQRLLSAKSSPQSVL